MALVDWAKAYRQLGVHPSQRRFLVIVDFEGRVWIDLAVGFGGVASCGVFGAPAETWKWIVAKKLGFPVIFRWVDDNLILRRPGHKSSLSHIEELSRSMGVQTNPKKNREFREEQRFLGFVSGDLCRTTSTYGIYSPSYGTLP